LGTVLDANDSSWGAVVGGVTAEIYAGIVVNAGGTLTIQAAQKTSDADTLTIYANSWLRVQRLD
jgi:hypothetical protein